MVELRRRIVGFGLRGPKIRADSGMHKNQTAKNIPQKRKGDSKQKPFYDKII